MADMTDLEIDQIHIITDLEAQRAFANRNAKDIRRFLQDAEHAVLHGRNDAAADILSRMIDRVQEIADKTERES